MTAGPVAADEAAAAGAAATSVRAIRSFVGRRRRRSWVDWYAIGFAAVIAAIYLGDVLSGPLSRLDGPAGHGAGSQAAAHAAAQAAAGQAIAGTGLVIGAGAGLLLLAQALGPLALSPADASWLLLSPLDRRAVLRRPAVIAALLAVVAGAAGGVLALAMAGPYLRPGAAALPPSWLVLAAVAGAGFALAAVSAEVLAQPRKRGRSVVRACCAAVALIATAGAVAGERWTAVAHAVTAGFTGLSGTALGDAAAAAAVLAVAAGLAVRRLLPRFPAGVLRTDSARAGRTLLAVTFLNLSLLAWIAEDNHWRGRMLRSRPWPKLPPAMVLAWADWRRLGRRPALLAAGAASSLAPALAGGAITGHARGYVIAGALLAGALAAGNQGTTATRRDMNDPTLRRMLGVPAGAAFAARAVLPALLATGWLTVSLALLAGAGVLHGWLWPLLGPLAGPGVVAGVLRIARTRPIDPTDQGPDTPLGNAPPWLVTRGFSVLVGLAGAFPALHAVQSGKLHGTTFTSQFVISAVLIGGYAMIAGRQPN